MNWKKLKEERVDLDIQEIVRHEANEISLEQKIKMKKLEKFKFHIFFNICLILIFTCLFSQQLVLPLTRATVF